MAYVTPGTVAAGDVATAAAWNVLTNDVIDVDSRITANRLSQVNVVSTTLTTSVSTTSAAFVDISGITVSITPSAITSKIHVFLTVAVGHSTGADYGLRLVRNSTAIGVGTGGSSNNGFVIFPGEMYTTTGTSMHMVSFSFLDSPASTSATTYKLQGGIAAGSGTLQFNRRVNDANYGGCSTIIVKEVLV